MGKGITVDELHGPIDNTDQTAENTEGASGNAISPSSFVLLGDAASLADHVDDGDDEGAEADAAEGVGHGALESTSRGALRHSTRLTSAEEPTAVHARDRAMQGIFDPFGDPVTGEGDKDDEADDFCRGASTAGGASGVGAPVVGTVFHVDGDEGDGVPGAEGEGGEAAECADGEDVAVVFGYVHGCLQHEDAEGDAGDPRRSGSADAGQEWWGRVVEEKRRHTS